MSNNIQRTTGPGSPPRCEICSTRERCLFAVLPEPKYEHFRSLVRERSVAVGELVELQGRHGATFGVVKVGLLKGVRKSLDNDGKVIALLGKGRLIGFTQPFAHPALLSLSAMTPVRICEVDVQAVKHIAMDQPIFRLATYRTIAAFIGCVADWSALLREDSFLTKVSGALQLIAAEEGSQAFRIPSHTELASVLGARRETIARHIAILIEKGMFRKLDRWHGVLTATPGDILAQRRAEEARP